jgi:hypothetical protein
MRIFIISVLVLALIVASFIGVKELIKLSLSKSRLNDDKSEVNVTSQPLEKLKEVALYFVEPDASVSDTAINTSKENPTYAGPENGISGINDVGLKLVLETRRIAFDLNLSDKVMVLIRELAKGSQQGMLSPIPKDTELRKVFVDRNGTAYLDFSPEISKVLIQGVAGELILLELILRTIQENITQIKKVQILIDGNEIQTIDGHIDMSEPLSLVQVVNK